MIVILVQSLSLTKKKSMRILLLLLSIHLILFSGCDSDPKPDNKVEPKIVAKGKSPLIDKLTQEIKENPQDHSILYKRAKIFAEKGDRESAILDLEKAIHLDSLQPSYHHLLADCLLDNLQSRKALNEMVKTTTLFPKRIPSLLKLVEYQVILKQYDGAFQTLERIFKIDPQNAEAFFMTGVLYEDMGKKDKAIKAYQKAVQYDSDLLDGWLGLGNLLAEKKDKNAGRCYDNAMRIDSNNVYAIEAKASYLANNGKPKESLPLFRKIIRINPQIASAYYNIGIAYLKMDSIPQAYNHFGLATKMDKMYVEAYYYKGYSALIMGNKDLARENFEQVLKFDPENKAAKEALAKL